MYQIDFSKLSRKQLKALNKNITERIVSTIERCRIRPYHFVKRLVNSHYYRLRVGDYRVIMDIKNNELRIFVIEVAHRKTIYKIRRIK